MTEKAMRASAIVIAALLASVGPAMAEPPKGEAVKADQSQQRPVQIVLASAEQVNAPTQASQPAPPPKRRVAPRVTTCRCGDPQVTPEIQEQ